MKCSYYSPGLLFVLFFLSLFSLQKGGVLGIGECGKDHGGALCQDGFCCSKYGYCGTTSDYCDPGNCQSQCPSTVLSNLGVGECGKDHGGALCQDGFCCSKYGYCGTTSDYCDPGNCQSQCPSTVLSNLSVGECGKDHGGALCQDGFCCSKYGYCGTTSEYCDPGNCQSQCPSTVLSNLGIGECGKDHGGALCEDGFCCSKYGYCGTTSDYCGPGNCQSQCPSTVLSNLGVGECGKDHGGALCPDGFCCSKYGYCGTTSDYCDPGNCQSQCPSTILSNLGIGECGKDHGGALCQDGFCCSKYGYCGTTSEYCDPGNCQSQCPIPPPPPSLPPPPPSSLSQLITKSFFDNDLFPNRNYTKCEGTFYTYDAFIEAAKSFPSFAAYGDTNTRKREIAAFFAQTAHETSGGWPTAPGGPYAWGYCFVSEINPPINYCDETNTLYPCAPGKTYSGRGPIQLSWNYNYGQAGVALGLDLLGDPDMVSKDPVVSFKTAIWFWMTPQSAKPSCHDVITGQWKPTMADIAAGRFPGYGVTTNIINGAIECGQGENDYVKNRIGYYSAFCGKLNVGTGDNLDCYNQVPFNLGLKYPVASMK